ncbi:hypothetical protein RB608_22750 [Nocardioides sp. LHD-245]|uniref:hypothetical protein n=1 Tax=Nocardioides sp. LHD-245 TaxID=3051387 RepID=UPI0027E06BCA|nr:hypothetical protein [Nocardioides sp. LHD-245]
MDGIRAAAALASVAATSVTALVAIARLVGPNRLRANMKRDAELHAMMPNGEARSSLEKTLAHEALALHDRVVIGRQLTGRQRTVGYSVALLAASVILLLLSGLYRDQPGLVGSVWSAIEVGLAGVIGLLVCGLIVSAMSAATDWLDRKTRADSGAVVLGPVALPVARILRRILRPWLDRAAARRASKPSENHGPSGVGAE